MRPKSPPDVHDLAYSRPTSHAGATAETFRGVQRTPVASTRVSTILNTLASVRPHPRRDNPLEPTDGTQKGNSVREAAMSCDNQQGSTELFGRILFAHRPHRPDPRRPFAQRKARIYKGFRRNVMDTPGRTRTCDPRLRRPSLYPAELRGRSQAIILA